MFPCKLSRGCPAPPTFRRQQRVHVLPVHIKAGRVQTRVVSRKKLPGIIHGNNVFAKTKYVSALMPVQGARHSEMSLFTGIYFVFFIGHRMCLAICFFHSFSLPCIVLFLRVIIILLTTTTALFNNNNVIPGKVQHRSPLLCRSAW